MKLAIYGAQGYALSTYEAIKTLYPRREISCFLVTRMDGNSTTLGGIPVKELTCFAEEISDEEKRNTEVLIATPVKVQSDIEETLENYGFHCHRRLTYERRKELMQLYHARLGRFLPLAALPVGYNAPFVRMYQVRSHVDKPLRERNIQPSYVFAIQAGTAGSSRRVADLSDDNGDNISEKNSYFCELTALYWIWKNKLLQGGIADNEITQYFGLCQYRREFELKEDDLLRLMDNNVDVVLPYPLSYEPDINAHHERYIKETDWEAMLQALAELQPAYAKVFSGILGQQYLYNYNLILAKKSVLREYCEWLFPILFRTEELSISKGSMRNDRYIGYIGETLETLYFMKNAETMNLVHTECRMLV